jgi:hypothetical protein
LRSRLRLRVAESSEAKDQAGPSWQRASAQKVNIALVQNIYMYQMNLK